MDLASDPKPEPFEKIENCRLWLNGDTLYSCGCGNTLFTQHGLTEYRCQVCREEYEVTPLREDTHG